MGLFEGAGAGAKAALCSVLNNNAYLMRLFRTNNVVLDTLSGYNSARFLYEALCDRPHPSPPAAPPFAGGQCPTTYIVTVNYRAESKIVGVDDLDEIFQSPVLGPIEGIETVSNTEGPDPLWDIFVRGGSLIPGQTERYIVRSLDQLTYEAPTGLFLSIVREDGQPDDCGDPGGGPPPPGDYPPPVPFDFVYVDVDNNLVIVNANLKLGFAYVDGDLNVHVPVTVNVPVNINPNFDFGFDFDIDFNIGDNNFTIGPPRDPGTQPRPPVGQPPGRDPRQPKPGEEPPPHPPDTPKPPDKSEDEPPEPVLRGCIVTVIDSSEASTVGVLAQNNNPDIAIPNFGYVNFVTRFGPNNVAWSPDFPVKNKRTLITVPWPGGAQNVNGTPRPGVQWSITPLYGPPGFLGLK